MADTDPTLAASAPSDTGAAPAPSSPEGQADGSPSQEGDSTSGGNATGEGEKELRRRLTAQAEEIKGLRNATAILERAMELPEFEAVSKRLRGETPGEDLDGSVFGEDVELGKKWKDNLIQSIEQRILSKLGGTVREVGNIAEERAVERALDAEGLKPSDEFNTFRADFAAENPSYEKLKRVDGPAAAKWLASAYSINIKRNGRTPVGDRAGASLERGGGSAAGVGVASSQVRIARNDPQKWNLVMNAIDRGQTPVDENGKPYPVPKR